MIVPGSPEHLELQALDARVDDALGAMCRGLLDVLKVRERVREMQSEEERRGAESNEKPPLVDYLEPLRGRRPRL